MHNSKTSLQRNILAFQQYQIYHQKSFMTQDIDPQLWVYLWTRLILWRSKEFISKFSRPKFLQTISLVFQVIISAGYQNRWQIMACRKVLILLESKNQNLFLYSEHEGQTRRLEILSRRISNFLFHFDYCASHYFLKLENLTGLKSKRFPFK